LEKNMKRIPGEDDLTTSEAAHLLGMSRQHLADMCDRGEIVSYRVGTHRRIPRASAEGYSSERTRVLDPSQVLALRLGRAAAARIAVDPEAAFAIARKTIAERWDRHPESRAYLRRWQTVLDDGPEAAMRVLTGTDPESLSMQNMSPFIATVSETDRERIARGVGREVRAARDGSDER
jgi:excisionase family DNA binding protein